MNTIWAISSIVQWVLLVSLVLVVAGILRYMGSVEEALRALRPGAPSKYEVGDKVGNFEASDYAGNPVALANFLGPDRHSVLLFMSASCHACQLLQREVAELAVRPGTLARGGLSLVLLVTGGRDEAESVVHDNPGLQSELVRVLVDREGVISREYGVHAVPTGLGVDAEGRITSQSMNPHFHWLYEALGVPEPAEPLVPAGEPIPLVTLHGSS